MKFPFSPYTYHRRRKAARRCTDAELLEIRALWHQWRTTAEIAAHFGRPLPWAVRALGELYYEAGALAKAHGALPGRSRDAHEKVMDAGSRDVEHRDGASPGWEPRARPDRHSSDPSREGST